MYIITFYSFKGGVGRTMALVNTAAELARRGRKVLLVDFDLEAPGLSTYDLLRAPKPHPGIVEYVTEFRRTRQSPLVMDFLYQTTKPVGKKGGQLWVMPAGRANADYRRMLNALNWRTLYKDEEGFLLFEDTRLQWEAELHPDFVLIDARTGHTDIEGICTRQLADAVVIVFHPNEQNLAGLREVCRDIRAEAQSGLKKHIPLHFVASNVPDLDDEDHDLRRHLNKFRDLAIGKDDIPDDGPFAAVLAAVYAAGTPPIRIIHRNESLQLLDQPTFVLQRPRSQLAREYRSLVRVLLVDNWDDRDGALLFLREVQKEKSKFLNLSQYNVGGFGGHMTPEVGQRINHITERFWNDVEVLFQVSQYLLRHKEPGMALKRINRVLKLQPDYGAALFERAFCHRLLRDDVAAANDLLHYLRDQCPNEQKKNTTALLELLSISADEFLKTFELPPVPVSPGGVHSHDVLWLLSQIRFHLIELIQHRRWNNAIHCLEHQTVKRMIDEASLSVPTWKPFHAFLLAIAQWGKAGEPQREWCAQAILAFQPIDYDPTSIGDEDDPYSCYSSFKFYGSWFQDLALLHWGAGNIEKAFANLDQALAVLREPGDLEYDLGISSWTFQTTTVTEYRHDCEEMRRMIRGEAVYPAFLGPPQSNATHSVRELSSIGGVRNLVRDDGAGGGWTST